MSGLKRSIEKSLKSTSLSSEIAPGSAKRRYEPEQGVKKHNERIHRESKIAKDKKNLPFNISKPKKPLGKSKAFICECGNIIPATSVTVAFICSNCGKFCTIDEEDEDNG